MRRVYGNSFLFLILISLIVLCSCKKEKEYDFDKYDLMFIDQFYNEDTLETYTITNLNAYYYDTYYYYDTEFNSNDYYDIEFNSNDTVYEVLYVFRYGFDSFFPIKDAESALKYNPIEYSGFIEAQEKGVKKEYSQEDISNLINKVFPNKLL